MLSDQAIWPVCVVVDRAYLAQYDVTVHIVEPVTFHVDASDRLKVNKAVDAAWKGAPWYVKEEFGEEYYKDCE